MQRMLVRVALRVGAVICAFASAFVTWNCWRQLERDRKYREELHEVATQIDARREQTGHQPSARELDGIGRGRLMLYARLRDRPEKLRSLGARAADDFMFAVPRGERHAYYYSWSGQDTTDSGAWILLLALGVPLAGISVTMAWVSRREERAAAGSREEEHTPAP